MAQWSRYTSPHLWGIALKPVFLGLGWIGMAYAALLALGILVS